MSGLQPRVEEQINGVDVREQGSALRVATNTPHLVSLGTGRFSTAVTLHPIKQGRMTIGSDPSSDIRVTGDGVQPLHCRVEGSHGVFTLYPAAGDTRLDAASLGAPTRLAQGCMITLGHSTYLRFNNPAEAHLMKSVLPNMTEDSQTGYAKNIETNQQSYQNPNNRNYRDLNYDHGPKMTLKDVPKKKPPAVPKKPNREDYEESHPKMSSIMAKVSKFEYYAKTQQKTVGKSQFYTTDNEISPKVFSSNSLTVNTPAKDVLGKIPSNFKNNREQKVIFLPENNSVDPKSCSYANVAIRNRTKIDDIVRNFDEHRPQLPKKVNNTENVYGKINNDVKREDHRNGKVGNRPCLPSPAFDRNPQYSPVYANTSHYERSYEAENRRIQAYNERVLEEEQKDAENARLEEILSMCAEYERQASAGTPVTPTEKRSHNKIITNGSLPRSVALNNPNFVQTTEGYYKFDTSHNRSTTQMSQSLPIQRNVSSYENYDVTQIQNGGQNSDSLDSKQNVGRMDEIGIPVYEENKLSSPILIRKIIDSNSPVGSPYENVYYRNLKPKSPNTQSPRSRIKTSFAHKNLPSPQYFVFPTPPPVDNAKPTFVIPDKVEHKFAGIEKQLSLEEEIPMIDDSNVSDDIEFRYAKIDKEEDKNDLVKNQSFDDVKKELMADIPELDEFEKDLKQNREKIIKNIQESVKAVGSDLDIGVVDDVKELRTKYESLKDERKKLLTEIHEFKSKMTEIRSQEDDILRELEMEKALIKGEYDSEIAILNIEQRKKTDLIERSKRIEDEIKELKAKQEARQTEMADRVEIATLKVERIKKDIKIGSATDEELQNAKDILDNETKIYEDLEFQHLEEESELLANREDLQNEITHLAKKIDAQKSRILTLKSEANNNLTSALDETKVLHAEYVKTLNQVEEITTKVQAIEKELKPIVAKLNDIERTQSPDSAFYTDQTRAKSGEFGYSPQSSDSDDLDTKVANYETHAQLLKDKFNSIDQMSQSMIVDIERRDISEIVDSRGSESPSKSSTSSKEKKGFWERNFDSLSRRKKKPKSPEKVDIMSQSLNENMFYNNDNIENETPFDRFNSLRNSKNKDKNKDKNGPLKSNSSSKIPTFAALGKIIKKDSFGRKKESDVDEVRNNLKNRYVKNPKTPTDNKYIKAKTPDNILEEDPKKENDYPKVLHRKSCGDEPNSREFKKMSDSDKVPSQDDIDRISKVTLDAPILSSDTDMNTLGKKTLDSLMEIERKRLVMLEEQGCQVIENERDRISELKRRVQDETKKMWDQKNKCEYTKSFDSDTYNSMVSDFDSLQNSLTEPFRMSERSERGHDSLDVTGSTVFDESSGMMSSIEELQVRNSRTESVDEEKRSDESRPLSNASDFSRENILSLNGAPRRCRRTVAPYGESQRPLTRYLPVGDRGDFDLRRHVESAGHQVELCPHVTVNTSSCRGYLHKLGAKFHTWSKRWFVFDRDTKTFVYYWDKSERKPRGGAYFQVIEEVYLDHGNSSRSPSPHTTFIVKTRQRRYYLMAPSGEAARIWIDVIFTGAQGYTEYLE